MYAVLAMHVSNLGIHTMWHFPWPPLHFLYLSTGQKESACSCLLRRSVKVGLFKTLGFVLRCAVACHFTISLRRLKLQGQNLPKSSSLRHSEKIVFMGDPKTRRQKIKQKSINWTIFIYFQENRLPRKIIYLPTNALLFWENHDFFFLLPFMLSYENTH